MTSPVQAGSNPVNPVLSRIGVKQLGPEIAGALLILALSVFAWRFWSQLPIPTTILLGLLLLVALAFVCRRPLLGLFGPVLFYDAIRLSRRGQYILLRCLYAGALLIFLFWQYGEWTSDWQSVGLRKPVNP
jgi:hypothetical protein